MPSGNSGGQHEQDYEGVSMYSGRGDTNASQEYEELDNPAKLHVILNATVDPRPAKEIALHTGVAKQTVHNCHAVGQRACPQTIR